jgi:hypothetical protein
MSEQENLAQPERHEIQSWLNRKDQLRIRNFQEILEYILILLRGGGGFLWNTPYIVNPH